MTSAMELADNPFASRVVLLGYSARVKLRPELEGAEELRGYLMSPLELGLPVLLLTDSVRMTTLPTLVSAVVGDSNEITLVLANKSRWIIRGEEKFTPGFEKTLGILRERHPGYRRDIEVALGLCVPNPELITAMEIWYAGASSERMNIDAGGSSFSQETAMPDIRGKSPFQAFGYSVGPGWLPIVADLFRRVRQITDLFRVEQVKEKFGRLRIYVSGGNTKEEKEQIRNLILCAELSSNQFCESCGMSGRLRSEGGCWRTNCDDCENRYQRSKPILIGLPEC